ncbi:hypothetical protein [Cylindrospermum stagnale]|uniref:hypothetical protein n=1 Tax=Cylindrospermum stagnale TaxID=142864 RepID=UPI0002F59787|nr:hypothetical protein [Cylindrospermum stagnale]
MHSHSVTLNEIKTRPSPWQGEGCPSGQGEVFQITCVYTVVFCPGMPTPGLLPSVSAAKLQ